MSPYLCNQRNIDMPGVYVITQEVVLRYIRAYAQSGAGLPQSTRYVPIYLCKQGSIDMPGVYVLCTAMWF